MFEAVTSYPGGLQPLEFRFDLAYAAEDALRSLASALTTANDRRAVAGRRALSDCEGPFADVLQSNLDSAIAEGSALRDDLLKIAASVLEARYEAFLEDARRQVARSDWTAEQARQRAIAVQGDALNGL